MPFLEKWRKRKKQQNRPFGRRSFIALFSLLWGVLLAFGAMQYVTFAPPSTNSIFQLHSTEMGCDLKYIQLNSIAKAKSSVYISSYGYSDKDLIALLKKKAEQNVRVKIVYDKAHPPGVGKETVIDLIKDIKSGLMHRKIVIIDGHTILLGSTNSTEFSLKMHKNHIVHMEDKKLADAVVSSKLYETPQYSYIPIPEEKKLALQQVAQFIDNAKKHIHLAIFTLTHDLLVEKMIEAYRRGVNVRVTIDPGMARGTCKKAIAKLVNAGVPLFQHTAWTLFHHKCALIDDVFITGSANWTKSGFGRNREYVIIFHHLSKTDLDQVTKFFDTITHFSKTLQISSHPVTMRSWRIPYFPSRFLSSCSWTPSAISQFTYPCSRKSLPSDRCGLSFEKCA